MDYLPYLAGIGGVIVYAVVGALAGSKSGGLLGAIRGEDGRLSSSKFQFFLWTGVVVFSWVAINVANALHSTLNAIPSTAAFPDHVMLAMGFSVITLASAKGITTAYVYAGRVAKGTGNSWRLRDLVCADDSTTPDLSKIQMLTWTIIAVGSYLYAAIHTTAACGAPQGLSVPCGIPDIDTSLMALMGIGQGAYLGAKVVATSTIVLRSLDKPQTFAGDIVTINGSGFGTVAGSVYFGSVAALLAPGNASWTDGAIKAVVPAIDSSDNQPFSPGDSVQVGILLTGDDGGNSTGNTLPFTYAAAPNELPVAPAAGSQSADATRAAPDGAAQGTPAAPNQQWLSFNAPPGCNADTMILLTDGTVLVHDAVQGEDDHQKITNGAKNWWRLTPNAAGSYNNGQWSGPFPMLNARQYFASGVMKDGRVFVVGGEYSDAYPQDGCALGEIFDPQSNTWSAMNKPSPDFDFIAADAASCILEDGRVIFGAIESQRTAIWDPAADKWIVAGRAFNSKTTDSKNAASDEETWTLLLDGSVLTVDISDPTNTQRYDPSQDLWVDAGKTPQSLVVSTINGTNVSEIGPAILMTNGKVFAVGGTGHTAIFDPSQGVGSAWTRGPDLPSDAENPLAPAGLYTVIDGPACLLPGGQIVFAGGKTVAESGSYWSSPTVFFRFDPSTFDPNNPGTVPLLPSPPLDASNDCWEASLLLLPNGQMLYSSERNVIGIYSPTSAELTPQTSWRPTISAMPSVLGIGNSYGFSGTRLNGLSQANSYGDDRQMATNWPLVRITDQSNNVTYLRTFNFSSMGVSPADDTALRSASFAVPQQTHSGAQMAPGVYTLVVIANGIASTPVSVTLTA
ncbi:MAG TPA: kelch repeat-containing protein [Candidatus Cybelea sp.]|nr:kelch repeat-containing protein [Candidatus Cybelea sp.]